MLISDVPANLLELAKSAAQKMQLDPALVCAVVEQESEWNTWAIRVELEFYKKYVQPMNLSDTEEYARSFSWGLMQIMGETAREFGYKGRFLSGLCDPATGLQYGCLKLRRCLYKHSGAFDALLAYNGGGNTDYPTQVIARMKTYQ